jgi:uncharacterized protein (TIGR02598 family)
MNPSIRPRLPSARTSSVRLVWQSPVPNCTKKAFSLIEITVALGVLSFALVSLLGLLPAALGNFRQSINRSGQLAGLAAARSFIERTDFADASAFELKFDEEGIPLNDIGPGEADPATYFKVQGIPEAPATPFGYSSESLRMWRVVIRYYPFTDAHSVRYSFYQADVGAP